VVDQEYGKTAEILKERRAILDQVAAALLEQETLDEKEFKALLGPALPEPEIAAVPV
jgi:cell division protease FtsH